MLVIVYADLPDFLARSAFFGQSLWQYQLKKLGMLGLAPTHLVGRFDSYGLPASFKPSARKFFQLPTYGQQADFDYSQSALLVNFACPLVKKSSIERLIQEAPDALEETDFVLLSDKSSFFTGIGWVRDLTLIAEKPVSEFVPWANDYFKATELTYLSPEETFRIDTNHDLGRAHLQASEIRKKELEEQGVLFLQPDTCLISPDTEIEPETIIYPNCQFFGAVRIGRGCQIGPGAYIANSCIGDQSQVKLSSMQESHIGRGCSIGPFANLRAGTILRDQVLIGDFVEVKKSEIGRDSKVPHLSYIGDALIGEMVNIGAGTITANYDAIRDQKNVTEIAHGVKVGSNSVLVAPLKISSGSMIAAGSVISIDVPEPDTLAISRPELKLKPGWVSEQKKKLSEESH
ncbi:MAG: hypothetical protein SFT81_03265 [Candidatus Caenarcaniphilales bacterium]|nr:hypothetical protein [Candidatus Caenarcaniphilales bacterium]